MSDAVISIIVFAGVLCMVAVPVMAAELIRVARERAELERRNGAQAVVIAEYRMREVREAFERECG